MDLKKEYGKWKESRMVADAVDMLANSDCTNGDLLDDIAVVVSDVFEMVKAKNKDDFDMQKTDCKLALLQLLERVIKTDWETENG